MNAFVLLVFVGWLFIWVMLPTKTYKNSWTPQLLIKLDSTYFREQGTNLLLFTFPIMLIAAVSCVYLHLYSKSTSDHSSTNKWRQYFGSWRRPWLVMEPLGIVNLVELIFAAMFIVLLIWSLANYIYISYGNLHMHNPAEKVWMAKFRSVSLRLGYIGNVCYAFLFFPVTRLSSILPLFGLTSESSIKYHIWLGHISMALAVLHSVGFVIYYAVSNQMIEMIEWSSTYVSNVAGEIAILVAIAMWVTSLYKMRRKMFDLFFYTHQLYTLYIFFYLLHVGVAYTCMILPGIFLFLIDRYLRFLQSKSSARLIASRLLPCNVVELTFSKNPGLSYNPTSILFVNVPSVSKLQWHPFTIASSSNLETDKLSVVVKCLGSWSQKLEKQLSSSPERLQISTEGPYGPSSSHFLSRECLVMISGGSGITPMISIFRELIYRSTLQQPNNKVPKVILITSFKNTTHLTMLNLLLPVSTTPFNITNLDFQIEAYVTRENDPQQHHHNNLELTAQYLKQQLIVFKQNPKDTAISAALGKSSWLWLGAIISSSFVMFLLLLGLVTRYSIYPIERDGKLYHYSAKIIWDMFLVCASVFIGTSLIFMWQKRENEIEGKQIQNVEIPTNPTNSPAACLCERELESLPHHSILQATKVHYGARPDLKSILFGCKASDVGVVVCGPKSMRHEVAKICASGLAKNLHFESISFNW